MPDQPAASADGASEQAKLRPGRRLHSALLQFWASLDAIRHLDEHLAPRAAALDEDRLSPAALTAISSLSTERQERLRSWWEERLPLATPDTSTPAAPFPGSAPTAQDHAKVDKPTDGDTPTEQNAPAAEDLSATQNETAAAGESAAELYAILGNRVVAIEFANHVARMISAPRRENLLRRSLLVTAFGAFEVLVGALVREFYLAHPGAIGDDTKFALKDLEGLETLDDAREYAISVKVDSLLQEDLTKWEKWFERYPKLTLANLCVDRPALDEMFQRRHIVVHNNGLVSRLYLQRLAGRPDLPALGTPLPITSGYLEAVLDEFDSLGTLLGAGVWCKLIPHEQEDAMEATYLRSYELMLLKRWVAVRTICRYGRIVESSGSLQEVFGANEWLAHKRLNNFTMVESAVQEWDVSALHDRFRFARFALLNNLDGAFRVAEKLLKAGEITPNALSTWPLLSEFREDERYQQLLEAHPPT